MIELPEGVTPVDVRPALIDFGGVQRPPTGAKILRINRLGNRFKAGVTLPRLRNRDLGRVVVSRLIRAKSEGMRIPFPLIDLNQGSPGLPKIKGAGQAGTVLTIDGCRAGYGISEGYWLSILTDGQHYLYNASAASAADASGEMEVAVAPPLRKSPADNDFVFLQRPMIEGLVTGDEFAWDYSAAHHIGIEFEIEEAG